MDEIHASDFSGLGLLLRAGNVRDNATAAHDAILEMLNLHDKGRGRLGDSSNTSGQQEGGFPGQGQGPGRPGSFS